MHHLRRHLTHTHVAALLDPKSVPQRLRHLHRLELRATSHPVRRTPCNPISNRMPILIQELHEITGVKTQLLKIFRKDVDAECTLKSLAVRERTHHKVQGPLRRHEYAIKDPATV